jgi:two-component system sensor histidine kinase PilS (NtrC family)
MLNNVNTIFNERTWLVWLVKVRIIIITFILGLGMVVVRFTKNNIEERYFIGVIVLWYTISVFFVLLNHLWSDSALQARLQVVTDLFFSTAIIYVSGGIDTSFNFLYPLIIIVASILLPRWWAYLSAAMSFIGFGLVMELTYFNKVRSFSLTNPDPKSLQAIILINLMAYIAIAYLSSNLSMKLRQVDVELQEKSGELANMQALHENIIHSMRGGLITTDLSGNITLLNPTGQLLLEHNAETVQGKPVRDLFSHGLPDPESSAVTGEVVMHTPSGALRILGVTLAPLTDSENTRIGYVYAFADLTEMRRLEREVRMRDRLAAVGRMAAGIAHEIRNPLSSIAGSVQVLAGISALNEDQRSLVNIVTRESERLNDIISDFLIYSREKKLQMTELDLALILEDTVTLLRNHPQSSSSKVEIEYKQGITDAFAFVDGDRIKQVFWNLCENAMRAMPDGGRLTVNLADDDNSWRVSFNDTGYGMEQSQMEKLFEPFQSSFRGGTGLGLAIVYQIMQAHDGQIQVNSERDKGTEFALSFKKIQNGQTISEVAPLKVADSKEDTFHTDINESVGGRLG